MLHSILSKQGLAYAIFLNGFASNLCRNFVARKFSDTLLSVDVL